MSKTALFICLLVGQLAPGLSRAATLAQATENQKAGRLSEAALQFFEILQNDPHPAYQTQAQFLLASTLARMNLPHSALTHWSAIFQAGPTHPFFLKGIEGLLDVARAQRDDTLIPSLLHKHYQPEAFAFLEPAALGRVHFYLGLLTYRQDRWQPALALLESVEPASRVYPKALFLQAILHIRQGVLAAQAQQEEPARVEHERAIALFERILALSGGDRARAGQALKQYDDLQRLWQLTTLNLARAHYGQGDFSKALSFYQRIPRFSQDWSDALLESGWAHFLRGEPGLALGKLHTLHSPYFPSLFSPESWLLEATIYFHACLFDEARAALAAFQERYERWLPALRALSEAKLAAEDYAALLSVSPLAAAHPLGAIPEAVRQQVLQSPRIEDFRHALRSLEREREALGRIEGWKATRLVEQLLDSLASQKQLWSRTAGGFVQAHLKNVADGIAGFVQHAKMIRLEITTRERELLQRGISQAKGSPLPLPARPALVEARINHWPFEQEYWKDELGYVEVTLRDLCPR